ncbi:MAG: efflux RND transporter periplasmic adaptor subunit, partial [Myxococcales bacterium]
MATIVQNKRRDQLGLSGMCRNIEGGAGAVNVVSDPESGNYTQLIGSGRYATGRSKGAINLPPSGQLQDVISPRTSALAAMQRSVALVALLASAGTPACTRSANAQPSPSVAEAAAVHVQTQPVATRSVPVWLTLTGQLKGSRDTDLAANANGRVTKTLVERGAIVEAGQPIAVIDTRSAALNLAEARASAESAAAAAENASSTCERYRTLAEQGAISQFEYDRVSVQCRTSELSVSAAKARAALAGQIVGDGVIRAPFAGSIAERFV